MLFVYASLVLLLRCCVDSAVRCLPAWRFCARLYAPHVRLILPVSKWWVCWKCAAAFSHFDIYLFSRGFVFYHATIFKLAGLNKGETIFF